MNERTSRFNWVAISIGFAVDLVASTLLGAPVGGYLGFKLAQANVPRDQVLQQMLEYMARPELGLVIVALGCIACVMAGATTAWLARDAPYRNAAMTSLAILVVTLPSIALVAFGLPLRVAIWSSLLTPPSTFLGAALMALFPRRAS